MDLLEFDSVLQGSADSVRMLTEDDETTHAGDFSCSGQASCKSPCLPVLFMNKLPCGLLFLENYISASNLLLEVLDHGHAYAVK